MRSCLFALLVTGPFTAAAASAVLYMDEPLAPGAPRAEEPTPLPPAGAKPPAHPSSSGDIFGDTFEVSDG